MMILSPNFRRPTADRRFPVLALVSLFVMAGAAASLLGQAPGRAPSLDDERLSERFAEAIEYQLRKKCWVLGRWVPAGAEIGPPDAIHTIAANEFPWAHPGGRFRSDLTRKFVWVKDQPTLYTRVRYTPMRNIHTGYDRPGWVWAPETTFFELHYHPRGWPFELRVLEKTGDGAGFENYEPHIFRPFSSPEDLPFEVTPHSIETMQVTSGHPRKPFEAQGILYRYHDQDVDWAELVKRPWVDDLGHEWHHNGLGDNWLSPRDYQGWMTGNGDSCIKCHETAGQPVVYFDPIRDWYGHLPGDDGIFSFYPRGRGR